MVSLTHAATGTCPLDPASWVLPCLFSFGKLRMSELKKVIVKTAAPVRLDRYIRRYFPSITQGIIEKALRKGQIKLNDLKSKEE